LPQLKIASPSRATDISNDLFDRSALDRLTRLADWDTLHFVSTLGLKCAHYARSRGHQVVYDSRQEHPAIQDRLVDEECRKWGITPPRENAANRDRIVGELRTAHDVIVPSEFAKRTFVADGFPADRVHVIPYGVNTDLFTGRPRPASSDLRLLFVGRLCARKGILNLFEAIRRLRTTRVKLTCIGQIDPDIRPRIEEYFGLFEHIESVANIDLPNFYADADVFVLPSIADSFGLVVSEALASGLPVLVTNNVGASDMIRDGEQGFVVPPSDADALGRAIARLLDEPDLLPYMRGKALEIRNRLGWERYETSLQELYASMSQRSVASELSVA
jgi:glycosyltransferase involved in cell wall biosynthesis